ncbi:MAG: hypothetical protein ACOZEN_07440 [Thermodesulfobacteriota bacterium]
MSSQHSDDFFHVEDKFLKVMADFCAEGLWTSSGSLSPYSLPLSDDLRERFIAWNWWYDLEYEGRDKDFDMDAFVSEGLGIAKQLKRELPDWTIFYFDEAEFLRSFNLEQETGQKPDLGRRCYEIIL